MYITPIMAMFAVKWVGEILRSLAVSVGSNRVSRAPQYHAYVTPKHVVLA